MDYFTVEPRYGTNQDMLNLIDQVHQRGMRLILDFVANHWSSEHETFQNAKRVEDSPYHDWYLWKKWPEQYESYFNVRDLPKLNLKPGSGAREYLLKAARYWLEAGFDGYRLDFAYGPTHDFWVDFRRACQEVKPDAWLFGEVIQTADIQRSFTGILSGTLDFLLASNLRETFALRNKNLAEFETFLQAHEAYFTDDFSRPAFLDNHDMSRFFFYCGENSNILKMAALVLYTLSNPPIIYYGTESGLSQERPMQQGDRYIFEEARLPMNWEKPLAGLTDWFTRLNHLRAAHPALWQTKRRVLHLDSANQVEVYSHGETKGMVLTAVNLSSKRQTIVLSIRGLPAGLSDRLNGQTVTISGNSMTLELDPQQGAFIA